MTSISTFHKWVLGVGLPFVVITPFVAMPFMFAAIGEHPRPGRRDMMRWVFTGEYMVNAEPLLIARLLLGLWIASCIAVVALAAYGATRPVKAKDRDWSLVDAPYWSIGDRARWAEGRRRYVGTVVEVHRRPFLFEGEQVSGTSAWPGLVMRRDSGELVARGPASVHRLHGSDGPSGTPESIREAANAAVLPGDEFTWLDADDELVEGVVVEKHERPFTVNGTLIPATRARPGYTVRRATDGTLVGITNDLREVP